MTGKTILCVDDDKQIRELIQTFLEGKGYQVVTAANGWDCLRDIIVKKPDCILLDVNMPKLDGMNTLDMIKVTRLDHHIPIILVSGEGDRETILKAAQLGADDFVVKPFSFEDLANRIQAQLYQVDFPRLQALTKLLRKESTQIHGLDLSKFKDRKAYPISHEGVEICVLLPSATTPDAAKALTHAQAATDVIVLKKTRVQWKCVWPLASPATAKAPSAA